MVPKDEFRDRPRRWSLLGGALHFCAAIIQFVTKLMP